VIFQRNEFEEEYENTAKEIGGGIMGPAIKQGIAVLARRAQRPSTTDINGDSPSKRSYPQGLWRRAFPVWESTVMSPQEQCYCATTTG